ncbi:hypothetical protein B0H13DRAFT_2290030 [Mycena leptocephala]|nr:hypothetical protein B0H13DRAFT_2290030 [Mycena leptocephala]
MDGWFLWFLVACCVFAFAYDTCNEEWIEITAWRAVLDRDTWNAARRTADDDVRELYLVWQGVVEMFRIGGFVDQPRAPRNDNLAAEAERSAARLSQNNLYNELNKILSHTEPST